MASRALPLLPSHLAGGALDTTVPTFTYPDPHACQIVLFTHEPSPQPKEAVLIQGVRVGRFFLLLLF